MDRHTNLVGQRHWLLKVPIIIITIIIIIFAHWYFIPRGLEISKV